MMRADEEEAMNATTKGRATMLFAVLLALSVAARADELPFRKYITPADRTLVMNRLGPMEGDGS
jgi:hypothetical protein